MAGTARICSTFNFTIVPSNTDATIITNPGRTFRVIGISGNNPFNGGINLTVLDGAGNNVTNGGAFGCAADSMTWADLDLANVDFAANENLSVQVSNAAMTEVQILCVETGGGEELTAT
jgi:hypothetical protein